jgi:threonine dehydrogenase-like Zn-dependent dehydrogenase
MRGLWIEKGGVTYRTDLPEPEYSGEDMLIRVLKSGICSTDLEMVKGYMEFTGIPGHEFVGIVADGINRDLIGKRVVGEINIPCRRCE